MLTNEQLAERMHGIGSSEVAAVCGLNPWRSAHDVWMLKRGLADETNDGNVRTRMGLRVESAIAEEYQLETGAELAHWGTVVGTEPWMLATPDRSVFGVRRLVEIKNVGWRSAFHWGSDADAIPDYYRPQVEWQMLVCDADETDVAAWLGGSEFRIYRIKRNRELGDAIANVCRRFWHDNVLGNVPPTVDGSDGARRMLAKLYPTNTKPMAVATVEANELAERLAATRADLTTIEEKKSYLENKLREAIGDADGVLGPDWKATFKADRNGKRSFRFTTQQESKRTAA